VRHVGRPPLRPTHRAAIGAVPAAQVDLQVGREALPWPPRRRRNLEGRHESPGAHADLVDANASKLVEHPSGSPR
jgi:hypothetical protein